MAHSDYMMAVDLRLREIARDMREIMRKVIFVTSHKEKTILIFHKENLFLGTRLTLTLTLAHLRNTWSILMKLDFHVFLCET